MFARSLRAVVAALSSVALLTGVDPTPASAEAGDTWTVAGAITSTTSTPLTVGMCLVRCDVSNGAGGHTLNTSARASPDRTGAFTLPAVAESSGYRIAVVYRSPDTAGTAATRVGYLLKTDNEYTLSGFGGATAYTVDGDLALGTLEVTPPKVNVTLPKVDGRVRFISGAVGHLGGGPGDVFVKFRGTRLQPDTTVRQSVRGCHGRVIASKKLTRATGSKRWTLEFPLTDVPRTLRVPTVVSEPGRSSWTYTFVMGPVPGAGC